MKIRPVVIGLLALSIAFDLIAQTPSVSTVKPISGYMRDVGLLYIETVEGAKNIEQLQTLRALEDRIDIQTVPEANKDFYERGLKTLRQLAEIRFADLESAELPARKAISDANRELDNILERNRVAERDYSQGLVTTKAYRAYLENSMALLRQKKGEAEAALEKLSHIEAEASSLSNESIRPYAVCDDSLRRIIKTGEYRMGGLENDCKIPIATPQQRTLDRTVPPDKTQAQYVCEKMSKEGKNVFWENNGCHDKAPTEHLTAKEAEARSWHSQYDCEKEHFVWRDGLCHATSR